MPFTPALRFLGSRAAPPVKAVLHSAPYKVRLTGVSSVHLSPALDVDRNAPLFSTDPVRIWELEACSGQTTET